MCQFIEKVGPVWYLVYCYRNNVNKLRIMKHKIRKYGKTIKQTNMISQHTYFMTKYKL